jgi:predicted nucleic acid-binding protein
MRSSPRSVRETGRRRRRVQRRPPRRDRLETAIDATTVVPVSDRYLTTVAQLRAACRRTSHPLADRTRSNDLWIAATAIHIDVRLVTADQVFSDAPGLTLA